MNPTPLALPPITPIANPALQARLQQRINQKTKPPGALGQLESLALQLGLIQQQPENIHLHTPQMVVFAGDHGIAAEGVSAFPQAVTQQMVLNMLAGGAAVNVFARLHGFAVQVVDSGVAADIPAHPLLIGHYKIAPGTRNAHAEPAMSLAQATAALHAGMAIVRSLPGNVVAFGEMGIANTSAAALLATCLAGLDLQDMTGRGTGLDDAQLAHKQRVLAATLALHADAAQPPDVLSALAAFGGFEIAMMTGAMLQAASERRVILVDGFIASAALLVGFKLAPSVRDYCVFGHCSAERGHRLLLEHLGAEPLLDIGLRLGEGTGALLAWPLVTAAAAFFNDMASFASAGVSGKS